MISNKESLHEMSSSYYTQRGLSCTNLLLAYARGRQGRKFRLTHLNLGGYPIGTIYMAARRLVAMGLLANPDYGVYALASDSSF